MADPRVLTGSGHGYLDGHGYGYGSGHGDGQGYSDGEGYGFGSSFGSGDGSGRGYGASFNDGESCGENEDGTGRITKVTMPVFGPETGVRLTVDSCRNIQIELFKQGLEMESLDSSDAQAGKHVFGFLVAPGGTKNLTLAQLGRVILSAVEDYGEWEPAIRIRVAGD